MNPQTPIDSSEHNHLALAALPSLGPTSAKLLAEVGINNFNALQDHGSIGSYTVLRAQFGKRITVNWIYAIECALQGIHWRLLTETRKSELRAAAREIIDSLENKL